MKHCIIYIELIFVMWMDNDHSVLV